MDKTTLITNLQIALREKTLSKQELLQICETALPEKDKKFSKTNKKILAIFYFIGATLFIAGIGFLLFTSIKLPQETRIFIASFISIISYGMGFFLCIHNEKNILGQTLFFIAGGTIPLALYVIAEQMGYAIPGTGINTLIAACLLLIFGLTYFKIRALTLLLIVITAASFLYLNGVDLIQEHYDKLKNFPFSALRNLILGFGLFFLGYYWRNAKPAFLIGVLYGLGTFLFLDSLLSLEDWPFPTRLFSEILFPFIALFMIYLSIPLKSETILIVASLSIVEYIIKITYKYFTASLGWPLSLMLAGMLFMIIGYGVLHIRQKYLYLNRNEKFSPK